MLFEYDDTQKRKPVSPAVSPDFSVFYAQIRTGITAEEFSSIEIEIDRMIGEALANQRKVLAASWMPGSDWSGTPFHPIWRSASAKYGKEAASKASSSSGGFGLSGRFFGQVVKQRFVASEHVWFRFYSEGLANSWTYIPEP